MRDRPLARIPQSWHARTEPVRAIDIAVALGLAALPLITIVGGGAGGATPDGLTLVLLLLASLPIIVRRRFPLEVFLVVVAATIVQLAIVPVGQEFLGGLGVLVAFYTVGERLDRHVSVPLAALAAIILGVVFLGRGGVPALQSLVQTELILGVSWLVGDAARIRHLYTQALEERALLIEREREDRTRRAILEERERIARELHDVVAHHASVVVVQAGGALRALDTRPEEARTALEAIATTGRQALTEMRRLVGILGDGDAAPLPRLDELDGLVEHVRAAGRPVDLVIEGDRRRLDPGLELSAFRIVQEGLTNSLKHGEGAHTTVRLRFEEEALGITIDDVRETKPALAVAPTPVEATHDGRGVLGMRERVALFGGTFEAAPTATGFRVVARLPIDRPAVDA